MVSRVFLDLEQLEFIDENLRDMVLEAQKKVGMVFTVTSLYRIGDQGVHGQLPLRGIDVRVRSRAIAQEVAHLVNAFWTYDPDRPEKQCCIAHGKGGNFHLHFQTHPKTIREAS